ncbi:MAG: hypothetical protein LBE71_01465 [Dysgonamonadaceae bacterium]|nr:hypothetical protein [Dysgonamonadaceae bacterium]
MERATRFREWITSPLRSVIARMKPEKIAQCWESTLLHTSYYELRKESFDYIDSNQLNYNNLSAGFCLYGNRGYIEMKQEGKIVKASDLNVKYFISNLEDEK